MQRKERDRAGFFVCMLSLGKLLNLRVYIHRAYMDSAYIELIRLRLVTSTWFPTPVGMYPGSRTEGGIRIRIED